jgi:MioC protein
MTDLQIVFGTESGNAEMVADEIAEALGSHGITATVADLRDTSPDSLAGTAFVLISSTYNEGDLPASAEPFFEALISEQPDLHGTRFAAFGLGDSTYEHYSNGVDTLRNKLTELGAEQVGDTGRHDAAQGTSPVEPAVEWATEIIGLLTPTAVN